MLFSVVIPTKNRPNKLHRAIRSVLHQTFTDFELIVVDDGSQNHVDQALQDLDWSVKGKIKVLRTSGIGPSGARNMGAKSAEGQWLVFLDDDDEATPEWLQSFANAIDQNQGVVYCGVTVYEHDKNGVKTRKILPGTINKWSGERAILPLSGAFAIRKNLFWTVGGYDEKIFFGENTELHLRVIQFCEENRIQTKAIMSPLVNIYRASAYYRTMRRERVEMIVRSVARLTHKHPYLQDLDPRFFSHQLAVGGTAASRLRDWTLAQKWFAEAWKMNPLAVKFALRAILVWVPGVRNMIWKEANTSRGNEEEIHA